MSLRSAHLSSQSLAETPVDRSASTSELSSGATASDLPGPGRLLGRLYSSLGRGLEDRLGSLVERAHRRRQRHSATLDTALTVLPPRQGPPSTTSSTSSANWGAVFSFSTVSSDETATNLPGPGRILGNLYSAGGAFIEERLNKYANEAGRGPDACAARIKAALLGEPYLDEILAYIPYKAKLKKYSVMLPYEETLFKECRRLLHYARSPLPATHNRAMQHIARFVLEDRYLYALFNALDAPKCLMEIKKRELKRLNYDSDWTIPHCRKALISLSSNEVNIVLQRYLRVGENARDQPASMLCQMLMKFLRNPELSFLALRYMAHIMSRWKPPALSFDLLTECLDHLADLINSLPHIVEWECIDEMYARAFNSYVSIVKEYGNISDSNALKWNKIFSVTLMHAHQLPKSIVFLNMATDIQSLLDVKDPRNLRVAEIHIGSRAEFPNNLILSQHLLLTAALFPSHLLTISDFPGSFKYEEHATRYDNLPRLVNKYAHSELGIMWQNLSMGPDVVTSEVLREHIVHYRPVSGGGLRLHVRGVPRESALRALCSKLAEFLTSPIPDVASRAVLRIEFVLLLDRYCRRAMTEVLSNMLLMDFSIPQSNIQAISRQLDISQAYNLDVEGANLSRGPFKSEYIVRHRARDGHTHLRYEQYRSEDPCKLCTESGIWDDPLDLPAAARMNDVFSCSHEQLMILEVPAGTVFHAEGHLPIVAGINAAGEREYIASVSSVDSKTTQRTGVISRAWTTVTDGADSVVYEDEDGVHTSQHFWVLVLRFDTSVETEERTRSMGGLDITGQCHWKAGKTRLHILNKEEADELYAHNRGILDPETRDQDQIELGLDPL